MVVWLKNIERLCHMFQRHYDSNSFTLLDVGCGSGISTLYFTQNYTFNKYIGFDFSSNLIDLANKNKAIFDEKYNGKSLAQFNVDNAKTIELLDDRYAIFMFNPFGWETMNEFISNNLATLQKNKSVFLYANDLHINNLTKVAKIIERDNTYNLSIISF